MSEQSNEELPPGMSVEYHADYMHIRKRWLSFGTVLLTAPLLFLFYLIKKLYDENDITSTGAGSSLVFFWVICFGGFYIICNIYCGCILA